MTLHREKGRMKCTITDKVKEIEVIQKKGHETCNWALVKTYLEEEKAVKGSQDKLFKLKPSGFLTLTMQATRLKEKAAYVLTFHTRYIKSVQLCWSLIGRHRAQTKTAMLTTGTSCTWCSGGETINFPIPIPRAIKKESKGILILNVFYLSVTFYKEIHSHSQYDTGPFTQSVAKTRYV